MKYYLNRQTKQSGLKTARLLSLDCCSVAVKHTLSTWVTGSGVLDPEVILGPGAWPLDSAFGLGVSTEMNQGLWYLWLASGASEPPDGPAQWPRTSITRRSLEQEGLC